MDIPIFSTYIDSSAEDKIRGVLQSTFISEGRLVREFESRLSAEFGLSNPVALNSGTSALHLALVVSGITEGDEVIMPAQTFIATGLTVLQQRATPVFADIDYNTGNISVESIRRKITSRTKAIMPVHWGGYPCDMDEINLLAQESSIAVIEDAAHALGASYKGRPIGSISDFTCFSFQAIKHLTTGDGGSLACLDTKMRDEAFVRRWFGIDRMNSPQSLLGERQYDVKDLGFKYHMNDYSAALGLANMSGFSNRFKDRVKYAEMYRQSLIKVPGLSLFDQAADRQSANWLFGIHVQKRDDFIKALKGRGIVASVVHQRIDRNSIFGKMTEDLPNQEQFEQTQTHIPLHDQLNVDKVEYIIESIKLGW